MTKRRRIGRGWAIVLGVVALVVLGRVGLIAVSISELGDLGASVPSLVIETLLVSLGVVGTCLLAVLIAGVPVYLRESILRRSQDGPTVIRAIRAQQTEAALSDLSKFSSNGNHFLPWIFSVMVGHEGVSLVRGVFAIRTVWRVSWADIDALEAVELRENGADVWFLEIRLKTDGPSPTSVPIAMLPPGLIRLHVLDQSDTRRVLKELYPRLNRQGLDRGSVPPR